MTNVRIKFSVLLVLALMVSACSGSSEPGTTEAEDPTSAPTEAADASTADAPDDGQSAAAADPGDELDCEGLSVRVAAANPGYPRLPFYIANHGGFFDDLGLTVELAETDTGADAAAALVGGSVDITSGTYSDVLLARTQGAEIAAFAATGYEEISNLVVKEAVLDEAGLTPESPYEEIVLALEGKRIGVTSPGASTDLLARAIVTLAGMDPDSDTSIVAVGASAMATAFANDQIDALVLSSPLANAAAANGEGVVAINFAAGEHDEISGALTNAMLTAVSTAEENETELRCFSRGLDRALALMKDDPEQATEIAWNEFEGVVDRAEFDATIEANLGAFAADSSIDLEGAEQRQELVGIVVPEVLDVELDETFVQLD